ncbi:hypothetical protein AVEN_269686-1 [Araneus ventricosus]|uniref:Uncharacterized protein n=1 Tax=Araneus ventricosus TaxID=182803 RepID=A0A4Y2P8T6_ARAVE|nr:hypothetical protein AVEN_269686-1 [Araneus ventricosus]
MSRGGLMVRSWLRDRRVPNTISPKASRARGLLHAKSYVVAKRPLSGVVRKFGEKGASRGAVSSSSVVQTYEVRPKIALSCFKMGR